MRHSPFIVDMSAKTNALEVPDVLKGCVSDVWYPDGQNIVQNEPGLRLGSVQHSQKLLKQNQNQEPFVSKYSFALLACVSMTWHHPEAPGGVAGQPGLAQQQAQAQQAQYMAAMQAQVSQAPMSNL